VKTKPAKNEQRCPEFSVWVACGEAMQTGLGKKWEGICFAPAYSVGSYTATSAVSSKPQCCLLVPSSFSNHTALNTDPKKQVKVIPMVLSVAFLKKQTML